MVRQTLIWVNQCILVLVVTVMLNLHLHNFRNFWDIWREREVSLICSTERRDQEDKADVGTDSITGESDDAKREAEQAVLGQKAEPAQEIEMGKATEDEEIDTHFKTEEWIGSDSRGEESPSSLRLFKVIPMVRCLSEFEEIIWGFLRHIKAAAGEASAQNGTKLHPWLEYSQSRDFCYCFACWHFSLSDVPKSVFTLAVGYRNWKKALFTDLLIPNLRIRKCNDCVGREYKKSEKKLWWCNGKSLPETGTWWPYVKTIAEILMTLWLKRDTFFPCCWLFEKSIELHFKRLNIPNCGLANVP